LRTGKGINKVAHEVGVGTGTVHRIAKEMRRPFEAAAQGGIAEADSGDD